MEEYTFLSATGTYVTVTAENEWRARATAMEKLYGPIKYQPTWLGKDWVGFGLMIKGEA